MNVKPLKRRESALPTSSMKTQPAGSRRYTVAKGLGLCLVAFGLIYTASGHSGRLIGSEDPLIDAHPGQFAAYFFAGFAGISGLDLIRRS